jgi:hypothetical protein
MKSRTTGLGDGVVANTPADCILELLPKKVCFQKCLLISFLSEKARGMRGIVQVLLTFRLVGLGLRENIRRTTLVMRKVAFAHIGDVFQKQLYFGVLHIEV